MIVFSLLVYVYLSEVLLLVLLQVMTSVSFGLKCFNEGRIC